MTPDQLAKSGTEHGEQRALFAWANIAEKYGWRAAEEPGFYGPLGKSQVFVERSQTWVMNEGPLGWPWLNEPMPQLRWLHAIHNQGHGDAIRGGKAKAEGVKAGVADVFLPVAAYVQFRPHVTSMAHGLYIEMKKRKGGRPGEGQLEFQRDMLAAGYQAVFAPGWREARWQILKYLLGEGFTKLAD